MPLFVTKFLRMRTTSETKLTLLWFNVLVTNLAVGEIILNCRQKAVNMEKFDLQIRVVSISCQIFKDNVRHAPFVGPRVGAVGYKGRIISSFRFRIIFIEI
jgi:hypothetical protein